jgi:hypothetical protein
MVTALPSSARWQMWLCVLRNRMHAPRTHVARPLAWIVQRSLTCALAHAALHMHIDIDMHMPQLLVSYWFHRASCA